MRCVPCARAKHAHCTSRLLFIRTTRFRRVCREVISRASIPAIAGARSEFPPTSDRPVKAWLIFCSAKKRRGIREEKTQNTYKNCVKGQERQEGPSVCGERERESKRERERESKRRRETVRQCTKQRECERERKRNRERKRWRRARMCT